MKQMKRPILVFLSMILLAAAALAAFFVGRAALAQAADSPAALNNVPFDYVEVDNNAGDIKLVGDIDGDTYPDLVLGGMPGEKLNWYHYPSWQKTVIATPNNEFTTDGRLGDVDGDGDLDIVVPDGDSGDNLVWFENPRPSGDPFTGSEWTRHTIGAIGSWGKDVHVSDYDNNGFLDVATRRDNAVMIFFQMSANTWNKVELSGLNTGHEGMTSGDVDKDTHDDLVVQGQWVRNPGGDAARNPANWTPYDIGPANSDFKALVVDLNKDGHMDVLFSSSENTADVNWWSADGGDPTGTWTKHTIVASLERCHTLQAADMDNDGDMDVVLAQMHTSTDQEIMVWYNTNGQATSWSKQVVDTGGLHNGVVADIGSDGDYDIYGANWTGNPPARLWINQTNPGTSTLPIDRWTYKQVTASHEQTFGLTFGDVDGSGQKDIISGPYWYQNPGGDLLGDWTQHDLPAGMHAILVTNVDDDALIDVIAQKQESALSVYWLEPTDATAQAWNSVKIGEVDTASHPLGAQGYGTAQIESGGKDEVIISSGAGIYYFRVPANPAAGNWPRVHVSGDPSDEGFAVGDVDRDTHLDIAATTGDAKGVVWYKNPGDGSSNWTGYQIGLFSDALYPDRTGMADLNGDGRLDIVVTEENGADSDAQTYWWEQPATATAPNWTQHPITTQATTNSLDIADMNRDGAPDVILAEHRGSKTLSIWANSGQGTFTEQIVSTGHESHLGGRTVDLDNDGDLDLVSIAYDEWNLVHLWRNDAITLTELNERTYLPLVLRP